MFKTNIHDFLFNLGYEKNNLPILNNGDLIYKKHNREHRIFIVKSTYNEKVKREKELAKKNAIKTIELLKKQHGIE